MNALLKQLRIPPWSNQIVSPFVRVLAWMTAVLFGVAFMFGGYFAVKEGIGDIQPTLALVLLGCFYLWLLFIHVARKGKAPSGWFPW